MENMKEDENVYEYLKSCGIAPDKALFDFRYPDGYETFSAIEDEPWYLTDGIILHHKSGAEFITKGGLLNPL